MALAMPVKGEFCSCPNCSAVMEVQCVIRSEYYGGEDYRVFDDVRGVWFEQYTSSTLEMAFCDSNDGGCDEDSNWEDWPEFDDCWKCSGCNAYYEHKETALDCCT